MAKTNISNFSSKIEINLDEINQDLEKIINNQKIEEFEIIRN